MAHTILLEISWTGSIIYCMYALYEGGVYTCVCVCVCVCGGGGGNLDGVMHNLKLYIVHMPVISCRSIKGE